MSLAAGSRLGPYQVLSRLGAGGMGEVWKARDTRLPRDVAIKVLPAGAASDPERVKRFEKEARAASSLNHPNIVTLFEIGREADTSYIVMELVDGRTLRQMVEDGPIPVRKLLALAVQIAGGLACAHEAGIVHRDLKPENLMVTKDGHIKILDFGLAKLVQAEVDGGVTFAPTISRRTEPGVVMGTVGYMSPEQASGAVVDVRSDQFSFGSVLYEMATGRRAFEARTRPETLAAIIRDEPEAIEALNPKVPPPVRWIVERCLSKDPEGRYASSKDLARDLASLQNHLSESSALNVAPVAATARPLRRFLAPALVMLVVVAAFLAGRLQHTGTPGPLSFRRLTFRSGDVYGARFAPDARTIVFSASWGTDPVGIFSTFPGSLASRALGAPGAELLSISPTGEMLVLRDQTLARVSLAGGAERQILEGVVDAAWAPNGTEIVAVRRPPSGGETGVTGSRVEFPIGRVLYEANHPLVSPRVSPRGDLVSFVELPFRGDPRGFLAAVDLNGKTRRLSEDFSRIATAVWSPRGNEIWFSAAATDEGMAIHAVSLKGERRIVAKGAGSEVLEDVSSDGRALVSHGHRRGVLMALTPGQARERDFSWLDDSRPFALSDDGRVLYLTEIGEGAGSPTHSVWMRPTDGSPAVRLGDGMGAALSPDGKWVLAMRLQPAPAQILLIPTGAGETRVLTQDQINHRIGAFLPDGRSVLFVGDEPGKGPRLYIQSLEGGPPRPISAEATKGTMWMTWRPVSPNGRQVVFFDGRYLLYPVDGGPPRPIPGLAPGEIPIGWDSEGGSLWVRDRGTPIKISRLDVSTGGRRPWREVPAPPTTVQFLMTPDGRFFAYNYVDRSSDLYLVEGLK